MKLSRLCALATVVAMATAFSCMQTAEAGFGIKLPNIGNITKSKTTNTAPRTVTNCDLTVTVKSSTGKLSEPAKVYEIADANPEIISNGSSAKAKTRANFINSTDKNGQVFSRGLKKKETNILVFVPYHGIYVLPVTSGGSYTVVAEPTNTHLFSISFDGFMY